MDYKLTGCPSCGACQFMGTASTMQCISEALGLALPGSALAPATIRDILGLSRSAGRQVMELIEEGITARRILTPTVFKNAIIVHAAIGGSTNGLIHLPAIAHELDYDLDMNLFDEMNKKIPHVADMAPSGNYPTKTLWFAGGIPMIQWVLRDYLDLSVMTVTGKTLGENLEELHQQGFFNRTIGYLHNYGLEREDVIVSVDKAGTGSVAILEGNLAPNGSVIKYSAVAEDMMYHVGSAKVFDFEEDCHQAIVDGTIDPGCVLFIRYEGPRGSGMPEMLMTTKAIMNDEKLKSSTVLITDGRYSDATKGPCIGHVSPEAAAGGPIALVEEGDLIELDIENRKLEIVGISGERCSPEEIDKVLAKRKKD